MVECESRRATLRCSRGRRSGFGQALPILIALLLPSLCSSFCVPTWSKNFGFAHRGAEWRGCGLRPKTTHASWKGGYADNWDSKPPWRLPRGNETEGDEDSVPLLRDYFSQLAKPWGTRTRKRSNGESVPPEEKANLTGVDEYLLRLAAPSNGKSSSSRGDRKKQSRLEAARTLTVEQPGPPAPPPPASSSGGLLQSGTETLRQSIGAMVSMHVRPHGLTTPCVPRAPSLLADRTISLPDTCLVPRRSVILLLQEVLCMSIP
jgi:hypothetical protein